MRNMEFTFINQIAQNNHDSIIACGQIFCFKNTICASFYNTICI